jgi:hypothetical protein
VVTIQQTLFVKGKGVDQEFVEHILLTVPNHLPVCRKNTMCARRGQHEWKMLENQNVESDCETCQSET